MRISVPKYLFYVSFALIYSSSFFNNKGFYYFCRAIYNGHIVCLFNLQFNGLSNKNVINKKQILHKKETLRIVPFSE